ncbi:MAG: hypothetical protein HYU37_04965 [Acidobacteria bacterium]|nr:hypothetical protein [Acidobacteriota bacterium]
MDLLIWLENTGYAEWVRNPGLFPYTVFLSLHAIGLALLVGPNAAVDMRILGVARSLPLAPMAGFFRLMWVGFWINAVSGLLLLPVSAVTFLTDPIFYVKLGSIALAAVILRLIAREVSSRDPASAKAKILAGTSLAFWSLAILAGRLIAYSNFVRWTTVGAFVILTLVLALVWLGGRSIVARSLDWAEPSGEHV